MPFFAQLPFPPSSLGEPSLSCFALRTDLNLTQERLLPGGGRAAFSHVATNLPPPNILSTDNLPKVLFKHIFGRNSIKIRFSRHL